MRLLPMSQDSIDVRRRTAIDRPPSNSEEHLRSQSDTALRVTCQTRAFGQAWVNHIDDDIVRADEPSELDDEELAQQLGDAVSLFCVPGCEFRVVEGWEERTLGSVGEFAEVGGDGVDDGQSWWVRAFGLALQYRKQENS